MYVYIYIHRYIYYATVSSILFYCIITLYQRPGREAAVPGVQRADDVHRRLSNNDTLY